MDKKKIAAQLRAAAQKLEAAGKKPADVDALVEKLADMTNDNFHTEAVVELAKWVGNKQLLKAAQGVKMIHDAWQSLPYEIGQFRFGILKKLWEETEKKYGDEIANKIKMGF